MKMENDHIVPLAKQAVEILRHLHRLTGRGSADSIGQRNTLT